MTPPFNQVDHPSRDHVISISTSLAVSRPPFLWSFNSQGHSRNFCRMFMAWRTLAVSSSRSNLLLITSTASKGYKWISHEKKIARSKADQQIETYHCRSENLRAIIHITLTSSTNLKHIHTPSTKEPNPKEESNPTFKRNLKAQQVFTYPTCHTRAMQKLGGHLWEHVIFATNQKVTRGKMNIPYVK